MKRGWCREGLRCPGTRCRASARLTHDRRRSRHRAGRVVPCPSYYRGTAIYQGRVDRDLLTGQLSAICRATRKCARRVRARYIRHRETIVARRTADDESVEKVTFRNIGGIIVIRSPVISRAVMRDGPIVGITTSCRDEKRARYRIGDPDTRPTHTACEIRRYLIP